MFKINNKDTRTTLCCRSDVFIVNFEHISHLVLVFLLLILSRQMPAGLVKYLPVQGQPDVVLVVALLLILNILHNFPSVSTVDFEQESIFWLTCFA